MIIGITGAKGSGKDTMAEALGFTNLKFAGPLKEMLRTLYRCAGVDEETIERKIEGDLKEVPCDILCGKTPRFAMQTLGTEWRDMIDRRLWTNLWQTAVGNTVGPIVCTDVRFHHEVEALRDMGGHLVRVERPQNDHGDTHQSETEMLSIQVDTTFNNIGSVRQLQDKTRQYVKELST
jgi:hypothetical protein